MKEVKITSKKLQEMQNEGFTHFAFLDPSALDGIGFFPIPARTNSRGTITSSPKEINLGDPDCTMEKAILWDADELPPRKNSFIPSFLGKNIIFLKNKIPAPCRDLRCPSSSSVAWTDDEEGWE